MKNKLFFLFLLSFGIKNSMASIVGSKPVTCNTRSAIVLKNVIPVPKMTESPIVTGGSTGAFFVCS